MVNSFLSSLFLLCSLLLVISFSITVAANSSRHLSRSSNNGQQCMAYRPAAGGEREGGEKHGHRVKRLSGGFVGNIREMPWLVYIRISYVNWYSKVLQTFSCTGSLVTSRHVLTAAHCIPGPEGRVNGTGMNITVFYGAANHSEGHPITIDWEKNIHVNPNYTYGLKTNNTFGNGTDGYLINDLALIDLGRELQFSDSVHPICVACLEPNQIYSEGRAFIAGWGNINLKCIGYTQIDIYPDIFNYNNVGIHKCLSAGFLVGDKVCVDADDAHTIGGGDSGGPVLASANNGTCYIQVGVTGYNHCLPRENAATKIPKPWFEEVTGVKCQKFDPDM